jgi:hypothetical protein
MMSDAYTHIEECWGLDANPFPGEAVSSSADEPHSPDVFPEEELEFRTKVVRGALQGGRKMTHLWSIGPLGSDTGFGKTSLMRSTARDINADWGATVQKQIGVKPERVKKIAAGFAEVNQQSRNGLYPVTFAMVQNMASGPLAILPRAREAIVAECKGDESAIGAALSETRLGIAPSGPPLRPDLIEAFTAGSDEFAEALSAVSEATQVRSGIQHFAFALIVLAAAGAEKCFVMIDQLEDLGKRGALSAAKRRREIGRIRDLLEIEPYAGLLHMSFTFHQAAATILESDWEANRLPSFEPSSGNASAVVVLRGLQEDDQVEALLKAWMERHYLDGREDDITPFTPDALTALRAHSEGRPGYTLRHANEVFQAAAEKQLGTIDAAFVEEHLGGEGLPAAATGEAAGVEAGSIAEDLLA